MIFNRRNLEVVDLVSKDVRPNKMALTGVCFSPQGTMASDGYVLGRVAVPSRAFFEEFASQGAIIIDAKTVKQVRQTIKKAIECDSTRYISVLTREDGTFIEAAGLVIKVSPLKDKWPDVNSIFRRDPPCFSLAIKIKRLKDAVEFLARAAGETNIATIHVWGPNEPVFFVAEAETGQKIEDFVQPYTNHKGETKNIEYQETIHWSNFNE